MWGWIAFGVVTVIFIAVVAYVVVVLWAITFRG